MAKRVGRVALAEVVLADAFPSKISSQALNQRKSSIMSMPSQVENLYSRVAALFFIKGQENTSGIRVPLKQINFVLSSKSLWRRQLAEITVAGSYCFDE